MVTATPTRTPHAVQSGPTPTILWLTLRAISLGMAVIPVLLLPVAGRHLIWRDDFLLPDTALLLGSLIAYAIFLAVWLTRRGVTSALNMRIPGQMRVFGPEDTPSFTTRVPGVLAMLVIVAAEIVAVLYVATHARGDHGVTALILTFAGVCGVGLFLVRSAPLAFHRRPGWRGDIGEAALHRLPSSVAMFIAGRFLAPRGELTDPEVATVIVVLLLIVLIVLWTFRLVSRGVSGLKGSGGVRDLAEEVSDGVLARTKAAPTLKDRERGTRVAQIVIYSLIAVTILISLAIALI